jgi:hypothetical protein
MTESAFGIRRITLYKHGLAHIERAGSFEGDQFEMTFPTAAMDDVLKSLVVIDESGGVVHGVDVERAEDRDQRLAEEPIQLSTDRSLLNLLRDLRGHAVVVHRREGGEISGTIIGIDIEDDDALKRPMLSVLTEFGAVVPLFVSSIDDVRLADDAACSSHLARPRPVAIGHGTTLPRHPSASRSPPHASAGVAGELPPRG